MKEATAEPLILPAGVRFPRADELPAGNEEELVRITRARLTTGFIAKHHTSTAFKAYFEANVHAPRLWALVRDMTIALLPDVAAPIVGIKDEDPILGPYTTRDAAIAVFEPFVEPLQHDGFLEFGLIHQRHGATEEVFVRSVKYVQVWTNQPETARSVFHAHGLPETPDLQFIDDYPRVSQTIPNADGGAGWWDVLEQLRSAFDGLPEPPSVE